MRPADLPTHVSSDSPIRVALVGYGGAGRIFHAPLISGVPGLQLSCIVTRQHEAVAKNWRQTACVATAAEAFAEANIDMVVIATPNASHFELAQSALLAGKHVVVDKPCTVTLAETEALLDLARAQGKVLTVFQNRRLDSDFLAMQQVVQSGELGRLVQVESHFDRYRPVVPVRWREQDQPGAGLWFDLGPHLVDQALTLFGMPDALSLDLACVRDGAKVNDWFHAVLRYDSRHAGLRVILHASTLVAELGPRWTVHGTTGSFNKFGLDGQEDALKLGQRPQLNALQDWGTDPRPGEVLSFKTVPGLAAPVTVRRTAAQPQGNYLAYYTQLRDHLWGMAAEPSVTPQQVHAVMKLLTLGEQSALEGRWLPVTPRRGKVQPA